MISTNPENAPIPELTPEQDFHLQVLKMDMASMDAEQLRDRLYSVVRLNFGKENLMKQFMKNDLAGAYDRMKNNGKTI